jgi:hypothetical protein
LVPPNKACAIEEQLCTCHHQLVCFFGASCSSNLATKISKNKNKIDKSKHLTSRSRYFVLRVFKVVRANRLKYLIDNSSAKNEEDFRFGLKSEIELPEKSLEITLITFKWLVLVNDVGDSKYAKWPGEDNE